MRCIIVFIGFLIPAICFSQEPSDYVQGVAYSQQGSEDREYGEEYIKAETSMTGRWERHLFVDYTYKHWEQKKGCAEVNTWNDETKSWDSELKYGTYWIFETKTNTELW